MTRKRPAKAPGPEAGPGDSVVGPAPPREAGSRRRRWKHSAVTPPQAHVSPDDEQNDDGDDYVRPNIYDQHPEWKITLPPMVGDPFEDPIDAGFDVATEVEKAAAPGVAAAEDADLAEHLGVEVGSGAGPGLIGTDERILIARIAAKAQAGLDGDTQLEIALIRVYRQLRISKKPSSDEAFVIGASLAIAKKIDEPIPTEARAIAKQLGVRYQVLLEIRKAVLAALGPDTRTPDTMRRTRNAKPIVGASGPSHPTVETLSEDDLLTLAAGIAGQSLPITGFSVEEVHHPGAGLIGTDERRLLDWIKAWALADEAHPRSAMARAIVDAYRALTSGKRRVSDEVFIVALRLAAARLPRFRDDRPQTELRDIARALGVRYQVLLKLRGEVAAAFARHGVV